MYRQVAHVKGGVFTLEMQIDAPPSPSTYRGGMEVFAVISPPVTASSDFFRMAFADLEHFELTVITPTVSVYKFWDDELLWTADELADYIGEQAPRLVEYLEAFENNTFFTD